MMGPAGSPSAEVPAVTLAAAGEKGTSRSVTKVLRCHLPGPAWVPLTARAGAAGELQVALNLAMALSEATSVQDRREHSL